METSVFGRCKCGGYGQLYDENTEKKSGKCHAEKTDWEGAVSLKFRVMCIQEDGQELCVGNNLSLSDATFLIGCTMNEHPEYRSVFIEPNSAVVTS